MPQRKENIMKAFLESSLQDLITETKNILESNKLPMRAVNLWKVVRQLNPDNEFVKYVMTRKQEGNNFPVELGQRLRHKTQNVSTFKMSDGGRYFVFTIDKFDNKPF